MKIDTDDNLCSLILSSIPLSEYIILKSVVRLLDRRPFIENKLLPADVFGIET